jgi:hypothetical protein
MAAAEDLVDALEKFIEAKMLHARLKNPESVRALDTARRALVEVGAQREAA